MLTDRAIKALKPTGKPYRQPDKSKDPSLRGLGVQVSASGGKTFYVSFTWGRERPFLNLGPYPSTTLEEARRKCREARKLIAAGVDPRLERQKSIDQQEAEKRAIEDAAEAERRRAEEQFRRRIEVADVADLVDAYVATIPSGRTRKEVARTLKKDGAALLAKKVDEVTAADARACVETVLARGAERAARNFFWYGHAAFSHGLEIASDPTQADGPGKRFPIAKNPFAGAFPKKLRQEVQPKAKAGERVLEVGELRRLWQALESGRFGVWVSSALKLAVLLGQRTEEIAGMRWQEFKVDDDGGYWEIPWSRIKTGRKRSLNHVVPLPPLALEVLRSVPNMGGACVFPKQGTIDEPMPYATLTRTLARIAVDARTSGEPFAHASSRDLRRTLKTHMARLRVPKEYRDRLQNHALNDVAELHYDKHDFYREKELALQCWHVELIRILMGDKAAPMMFDAFVRGAEGDH
jgi:integrase